MSLKIENLSFSYNGKTIIEDISFLMPNNSMMFIIGHNGAGKSTLLKIISGIYKNYRGKCLLEEKEVKNASFSEIAKIVAYVPGEIFCPFDFNVENIIAMGLNPYKRWWEDFGKEDMERVYFLMKEINIEYLRGRSINRISSGEKQLVFLAQALIQGTKFLLLDEPTSHLDLNFKMKIIKIIANVKRKISVVVVSHDLKVFFSYSDLCLALKQGKAIFFGKPSEVSKELIINAYNIDNQDKISDFI